jgi:hypothetical protein
MSYHQTAEDKSFHAKYTRYHKLVLIGGSSLVEISKGGIGISRRDLEITHEEADNIIAQQVMICAQSIEQPGITVISDDTNVFVLLLHYCHKAGIKIALKWSHRSRIGQPSILVKPWKNTQISSEKYFQFTL